MSFDIARMQIEMRIIQPDAHDLFKSFFAHLTENAPDIMARLPRDLEPIIANQIAIYADLQENLNRPEYTEPELHALGAFLHERGFNLNDLDALGKAFIDALEDTYFNDWCRELEENWLELLSYFRVNIEAGLASASTQMAA